LKRKKKENIEEKEKRILKRKKKYSREIILKENI